MPAYTVYEESREFTHKLGKRNGTRTLLVSPATAVPVVLDVLLGTINIIGERIVRTLPHRDPIYADCWCVDVKETGVETIQGPTVPSGLAVLNAANYSETARLVASYETTDVPQNQQGPGTDEKQEKELASEAWDFGGQQFKLPNEWVTVGEGTDKRTLSQEGLQLTKTIPTVTYGLTRHFVPRLPDQAITQLMARTNYDVVILGGRRWAKEMVRFDGLHSQRKIQTKTRPLYELQYKWAVMPVYDKINDNGDAGAGAAGYVGWNRIFWAAKGYWTRMKSSVDVDRGTYLYDYDSAGGAPTYQQISQSIGNRTVKGFDLLFHPGAS